MSEIAAASVDDRENRGWELLIRAQVAVDESEPDAPDLVDELGRWWAEARRSEVHAEVEGLRAELLVRAGAPREALAKALVAALSPIAAPATRLRAWVTAARAHGALGATDDLQACADRMRSLRAEAFWRVWARVGLAAAWLAAGRADRAREELEETGPSIESDGMRMLALRAGLYRKAVRFEPKSFHRLLIEAREQGREAFLPRSEPALTRRILDRALEHGLQDEPVHAACELAGIDVVSVSMLGGLRCWVGRREVAAGDWVRPKAKTLLAYLALHPRPLHADEVAEALWPNRPPDSSRSALHTTLSYVRKALGLNPFATTDSVIRRREGVRILLRDHRISADRLLESDASRQEWFAPFLPENRFEDWAQLASEAWAERRRRCVVEAMTRAIADGGWDVAQALGRAELSCEGGSDDSRDSVRRLLSRCENVENPLS